MIAQVQPVIFFMLCLMTNVLTGICSSETGSSDATTSSILVVNSQKLDILATLSKEIQNSYQDFISANPGGDFYTFYVINGDNTTIRYDGSEFSVVPTTFDSDDIREFIKKRHQNCLNRNNGLRCQGCDGKFLGYSSAHNCNGKHVSCCLPSGGPSTSSGSYGFTCYKKNQAVKLDLGSAGCCS